MDLGTFFHHLLTFSLIGMPLKLSTGAVGAGISYIRDPDVTGKRTIGGFFGYCLPREVFRNRNVYIDICFTVLNRLSTKWIVIPIVLLLDFMVPAINAGLTDLFGAQTQQVATIWVAAGLVIVSLLVRDFMEFAAHALSHKSDYLWEFHKIHHSSEFLSPFGEFRSHVGDDIFRRMMTTAGLAVVMGVYTYAFGLSPVESAFLGGPVYLTAFAIICAVNLNILHHSHIPLSFGKAERFFMSPLQHHLHHNRVGPVYNFGSFLAIWDQMFGSFSYSKPRRSFELGLEHHDQVNYRTIPQLYLRPFVNIYHRLTGQFGKSAGIAPAE